MVLQRGVDDGPNAVQVAEHFRIPEANDPVAFGLDHSRASRIALLAVLSPINLDDELRTMTRKIDDEVPDRNLSAKVVVSK